MNNWRQYITPPNIIILAFMVYFVIYSERKLYVNTGPDPATIQFQNDFAAMKSKVEALEKADSIQVEKIKDYAKIIIENNNVVDGYTNEQLDSAFAALTRR